MAGAHGRQWRVRPSLNCAAKVHLSKAPGFNSWARSAKFSPTRTRIESPPTIFCMPHRSRQRRALGDMVGRTNNQGEHQRTGRQGCVPFEEIRRHPRGNPEGGWDRFHGLQTGVIRGRVLPLSVLKVPLQTLQTLQTLYLSAFAACFNNLTFLFCKVLKMGSGAFIHAACKVCKLSKGGKTAFEAENANFDPIERRKTPSSKRQKTPSETTEI